MTRLCKRTVYEAIRAGDLAAARAGHAWRCTEDGVLAWIARSSGTGENR
jgi:excisionase family DNA binding protein